mmetsp:Transcript_112987/g.269334  ORF Transcript_112987/g.269334 Transcript_112987/m.269334 type:complete len:748 (+) Transcript_112987:92-2335(+)
MAASPWSAGSGSNPPATPRLPPLEGEATARLVQGLKKLQDSAERFAPCLSARPLRSISYLGQVANSRLHEADVELGAHESQVYANLKKPPADLRVRAVADPLSSPTADGARLRPVKQDDMVLETLKMQEMRYYKVAVPSRPVVVTVTVTKTSGVMPCLWGSTLNRRPNNMDNDYKGKDDKLVYEHAVLPSEGEEVNDAKRVTAPSCREFYFSLDSHRGECTLKFVVTFSNFKIKDDVFSPKARARRGWEARLAEVTKTPQSREEFEERLQAMQSKRRQKIEEISRGQNFLEANQLRLACETSPQRHVQLQKRALLACHRRDVAFLRRERLEEEKEERHVQWMSRAENKRREREQQELQQSLQLEMQMRQQSWLTKIFTASFVKTVAGQFQERRTELEKLRREFASATVLDSLFRRTLVRKRRNMIWRNAIKLRMAMTVYARTVLPMVKALSAPLITDFLTKNSFSKEAPSIHSVFSHYRASVIRIQRFWLGIRMARKAYLHVLLPVWTTCERKACETYHKDQEAAARAAAKAQDEKMAQIEGVLDGKEGKRTPRSSRPESKDRGANKDAKKRVRTTLFQVTDVQLPVEEDLPGYITQLAIYSHIADMQWSFPARAKQWEASMQQAKDTAEVENFLVTSEGESSSMKQLRMSRPRKIYVDEEEIMALVRRTLDSWHRGGFVHVKANRLRVLRFGWRAFLSERMKSNMSSAGSPGRHATARSGERRKERGERQMKKAQSTVQPDEGDNE